MKVVDRYRMLLERVVERKESVLRFTEMLERKTTWLASPASSRFHLNIKGGLLRHSVAVTETLLKLRETLAPDISEESCIIVGLFHDAGKVGMPGKPYYIPNPNEWEAEHRNKRYLINPDLVNMGIATRSLYLIAKYIDLSDEEAQAIAYHDGMYVPEGKSIEHNEEPLTLLLHWADYWATRVLEDGTKPLSRKDYYSDE